MTRQASVRMPRLHRGQHRILTSRARFKVVACGRRFGKTLLGSCLCVDTALRGGIAWWVAPDFPRAAIGWRMILKLVADLPGVEVIKSERMILLPSGGWIQIKSASDPDTLRGEGLNLVVVDECADVPEEAWFEALWPALTDKLGSAVFIGTPKGRNWFYRLWLDARRDPDSEAFRMPSHSNPFVSSAELEKIRRRMPDRIWRQEFLAEFVTFEGRVYETFAPDGPMVFEGDVDRSRYEHFFAGMDFGFRNPTAIVVGGRDGEGRIDLISEVYETRLKPEQMAEICRDLQAEYEIEAWWGDAADPRMIDFLADEGIPIEASPRTKGGQDTFVQYEIRLVSGMLEEDPPAIRFHGPSLPNTIREHDSYRYPKRRGDAPEKEGPLKVNDHTCNAVQYLIHGLSEYFGDTGEMMVAGEVEAYKTSY